MTREEQIKSTVITILSDYMKTPSWWPFDRYPTVIDSNKKLIGELKIDDEDLTFDLIPQIQKELRIAVPDKEWETVVTIQDMINVLMKHE